MITYVDTSSLLKMVVEERGSAAVEQTWAAATTLVSTSIVEVEAFAGLAGVRRGRRLTAPKYERARSVLRMLLDEIDRVEVTQPVITAAVQVAETHGLRAYDAVHLAAAIGVGAEVFASADATLCDAAANAGLAVANPLD